MSENTRRKTILLIDDDDLFRSSLVQFLNQSYKTIEFGSAEDGLNYLQQNEPDIAILDIMLPGIDGIELLRSLKSLWPECPVLMLSALDQISKVVEAIKSGAFDYLAKPVVMEELFLRIRHALESSEFRQEIEQRRKLQIASNKEYRLIGTSQALDKIRSFIKTAATSDTTVLIEGETGTGKEIIAREIHAQSARSLKPFVAINCGALPKDLIESELFGYKKGAFTGAHQDEPGKFFLANHGTILLDEIGELPVEAQAKLLRIIEEQEYYPVGGNKKIKTDVRILASTNRDLRAMSSIQQFREDLYYRLNILKLRIPPLRERPEDIPEIAEWYIGFFNRKFGKHFGGISREANEIMLRYPWPGNVRELRNLFERIILFESSDRIMPEHLSLIECETELSGNMVSPDQLSLDIESHGSKIRQLSKRENQIMLMIAGGKSVGEIAEELQISVKTVSTFRTRILMKMNMKNNADICYYAIKNNLLGN